MKRFSGCAFVAFSMIILLVWPGAALRPAQAAPLPASFTAQATSSVATVSANLTALTLAGVGVAQSQGVLDSTGSPRSTSLSRNVSAAVAGIGLAVESGSQTAPPDDATPSTGALLGASVPGLLTVGALTRSNSARWAGDAMCLPRGTALTDTTTQTAGLAVGDLLSLGASSSSTSTSLAPGTGPYNRAVRSSAQGSITGLSLLDGAVSVTVSESPVLAAQATGVPGTASVTPNDPIVTVTGPGGTTVLQLGATTTVTVPVSLVGSATVTLNPPVLTPASDGLSATGTWDFLDVSVGLLGGLVSTDVTVLPLSVSATAPSGGIDCPPPAPVIDVPAEGATTGPLPTISGTSEPGAAVTLTLDGAALAPVIADGGGDWSFTVPPGSELAAGPHDVTAAQTVNGAESPSTPVRAFSVDTTAPDAPVVTDPADGSSTNDVTPTYAGTAEPGSTVEVFVDGSSIGTTTVDGAGDWSLDQPADLAEGEHEVYATATDAAGNVSPDSATNAFTIDVSAPAAPVITAPADGSSTTDATPTYVGTAEPNTAVEVFVDGSSIGTTTADGAGDWTLDQPTDLADGDHEVSATATDAAGNVSPESATTTFAVDATAPAAPVITIPADGTTTADATPTYVGTAEPNTTVEVFVDTAVIGTTTADGAGDWSLDQPTDLGDEPHTVVATATDAAGNTSDPDSSTFVVDTTSTTPVVDQPADGSSTNDTTPQIGGTADPGDTVTVTVDSTVLGTTTAGPDGSWTFTPTTPLAPGEHTVTASAEDVLGNASEVSEPVTFTIDVTAPDAPVITSPTDGSLTSDPTPPVRGTGEPGATVTVFVDGTSVGETLVDPDGVWELTPTTPLTDGDHVITATQTDPAGTTSPASDPVGITVDTTAPEAPVVISPADGGTTTDPTPEVTGTGDPECDVTVTVDGTAVGAVVVDADGTWSVPVGTPLGVGDHVVRATQTDPAGNTSEPGESRFTVEAAGAGSAGGYGNDGNAGAPTFTGGSLAQTGVSVLGLLLLASTLLGVGSVALVVTRRQDRRSRPGMAR